MPCSTRLTWLASSAAGGALLLWCGLWLPLQISAGQKAPPKSGARRSLADYFLAIPENYLPNPSRARRRALLRPEHIAVRDERNGYMQIAGDGARPTVTIAKFRKADGTFLVALTADYEMGSVCYALDDRSGQLTDVSRSVIPDYANCPDFESSDCHVYELPRYGTTIAVKDGQGQRRYTLRWRGERFERAP
ncbi:MAG: hypothetical protein CFK52_03310 [Chloracidobacterium sp. CP2_5A]|nr:MAG: hypothetical protein CFK52_03310 [Chloracidobacterium sp. CP2_5A]